MAKFKNGVDPKSVTFDTGYGQEAIESFTVFERLQSEGVIGRRRFRCIPTPLAPGYNFVSDARTILSLYIPIILSAKCVNRHHPHELLSIQWDVCREVLMWEDYYDYDRPGYKEEIFSVLAQIGDGVPADAELGYHLCYGSPRDEHLVNPRHVNMVEMMHGIAAAVNRTIEFFHIPAERTGR